MDYTSLGSSRFDASQTLDEFENIQESNTHQTNRELMMTKTTIEVTIIGAGHMGSAIALGLKRSSLDISITTIDPDAARRDEMTKMGVNTVEDLPKLLKSDCIILAIAPQSFKALSKKISKLEKIDGAIISVMAGISTPELAAQLNTVQVCRAIPNLACAINQGLTALTFAPEATEKTIRLAEVIFSSLGKVMMIKDEALIDSATALIGGGPAYISYFAAALIEYAVFAGFNKEQGTSMAIQSLRGTTSLLEANQSPPMTLCEKVTTPEGTTIQAINFFNHQKLREIIVCGLKQARERSTALGRGD
ncbi:pyrroline-5-carboxylate reductase [Pseudomonas sp. PDM05]|uniref:pyrroline-5-carboxylate reductase family protein n=1 Tax=Pseudomonas sp. PDM05 TaxID=2769301 RepID=UPI0017860333|nr:pyrroline-5-carboxylate reductase [Pseudomonas sp. PDM05]MBD9459783.1 pyrroline-5-carboxylate reductase [Pseudomonas sp. PDM05]